MTTISFADIEKQVDGVDGVGGQAMEDEQTVPFAQCAESDTVCEIQRDGNRHGIEAVAESDVGVPVVAVSKATANDEESDKEEGLKLKKTRRRDRATISSK